MRFSPPSTGRRLPASATFAALAALSLSACGAGGGEPDLIAGKQLFASKCGSCHVLGRADSKGLTGPNLDDAFRQPLADGLGRSGIAAVIRDQIKYPATFGEEGDKRADDSAAMPANLVNGDQAGDVAAYVASVVAKSGKDSGLLATAVKAAGGGKPAVAKDGTLSIAADPGGQLAYVTNAASAPPGPLTVESPNESSVPHNIVIDDKGAGEVVQDGGVSRFEAQLEAGELTFYCSVPGHREAGMEGKLTVK